MCCILFRQGSGGSYHSSSWWSVSGRLSLVALLLLAAGCSPRPVEVAGQRDSGGVDAVDVPSPEAQDSHDPAREAFDAPPEARDEEERADVADTVQEDAPIPCSGCRQVTFENDPGWELIWFTVRGDYLVYDVRRYHSRDARLVLVELASLERGTIITLPNEDYKFCREPSIHEDKLAFMCGYYPDYPDLDRAIYELIYYDIRTDEKSVVRSILFDDEVTPNRLFSSFRIWEDHIAWVDCRRSRSAACYGEVALFNMSTGEEFYINDGREHSVHWMEMWEEKIVYQADEGDWDSPYLGKFDIFVYDIPSGQTTRLTEDAVDQCYPDIWEDRIVWTDCRNDPGSWGCLGPYNSDIYMMELGGEERPVETEGSIQNNPRIYGDIIVWDDERNDITPNDTATGNRWEVFALDIRTGEKRMITESVGGLGGNQPQVNEGKVYLDLFDEHWILNVYELPF
jgi:beta propeller repeat protein